MKAKQNRDFTLFQKEFKKWQSRFGLTGYKVYFKYEPTGEYFANIEIDQAGMVATVRLNSQLADKHKPFRNIRGDAKHEALHLLLHRVEANGTYRYLSEAEMRESIEEVVNKLVDLV